MRAFCPSKSTSSISVSASSQNVKVASRTSPTNVRIVNNGTATVWLNYGDFSVTASASTGFPVGPGVHEIMTFSPDIGSDLYIAAIAAGSTGSVYFTVGDGL